MSFFGRLFRAFGRVLLVRAAWDGHTRVVASLLALGADVQARDSEGYTALILASGKGHTEIVDRLLDKGADVQARDSEGRTAVMLASRNGHTEIVDRLIDKGADVPLERTKPVVILHLPQGYQLSKVPVPRGEPVELTHTQLLWCPKCSDTRVAAMTREIDLEDGWRTLRSFFCPTCGCELVTMDGGLYSETFQN